MARYGMVIDTVRCFGCHTCEATCKVANNNPIEVAFNKVHTIGGESVDTASGHYPDDVHMSFLPVGCQHCANPACLPACPTAATQKDPETGIVYVESDRCIGCGSCIIACPYEGVRTLLPKEPTYYLDVVVGEVDAPKHVGGTVEKCTFCHNLISRGEPPACMQMCPGRARYWGDLDDPSSEVAKLVAEREHMQLSTEYGTEPNVYYLV